jgi:hypothetical protein
MNTWTTTNERTYNNEYARIMRALRVYRDDMCEHVAKSRHAHVIDIDNAQRDDVCALIVRALSTHNATTIDDTDACATTYTTNATRVYVYKHDDAYVSIDVLRTRDAHDIDDAHDASCTCYACEHDAFIRRNVSTCDGTNNAIDALRA